ncbi:hypothetical protein KW803_01815 [Candidatus Saccharibacteria bacterium]|nr:hypothetical protein [Candidatus Saccharibacteria bacterium]
MAQSKSSNENVTREYRRKDTFWRRWLAVFILFVFFFASWGGQFASQLEVEKQIAEQHNQQFQMSEFWPEFWQSTFENWQSEWLQLATQALLIAAFADFLFRKGQEDNYKTHLMIEQLRNELAAKK